MRIPLDTGPLEEGRSNMSFDYLYTNFEPIKFHDFPWLMLIFEKFLSYSHFWDYQQSTKKHNSVGHLQRHQFSFTKTNEYLSVSKNPQVFTSKLKDEVYVLSPQFPGVCFFQRWTHDKKIAQSFLSTAKIITEYCAGLHDIRLIRLIKVFIYFLQIWHFMETLNKIF